MVDSVKQHVQTHDVYMFVPDLHSFTTPIEHSELYSQTMRNLEIFTAAGLQLEDDRIMLYRQSYIPAHSEMAWILSNFTGFGEMSRMVEFKSKTDQIGDERVSVGLFSYPILMAADILLYGAKWVPVGEDQRQHLEFSRDIAERLNNKFGDLFIVPASLQEQQEFVGRDEAPRIRSLRHPDKKMSKSVSDPSGTILLSDSPEDAAKKIMSAETDSLGVVGYDWQKQPGVTNLLTILASLKNETQATINQQWQGKTSYGDLKKTVADTVAEFLADLQTKIQQVDQSMLTAKLEESEARANQVANEKLLQIQKAIGLRAS